MRARPVGRAGASDREVSEATSELNHGRRERPGTFFEESFVASRLNLRNQ